MKTILKTSLSLSDEVIVAGRISSSQDGIVVMGGISPCHTAGHRNCPKIVVVIESQAAECV